MRFTLAALVHNKIVSMSEPRGSKLSVYISQFHPADMVYISDLGLSLKDVQNSNCQVHILSKCESKKLLDSKFLKNYFSKYLLIEKTIISFIFKRIGFISRYNKFYKYKCNYEIDNKIYYCYKKISKQDLDSVIYSNFDLINLSSCFKGSYFITQFGVSQDNNAVDIVFDQLEPAVFKSIRGSKFSNRALRLFSLTGIDGFAFKSAPYYYPKLAKHALDGARSNDEGMMVLPANINLQLLAFHMLFHGDQYSNLDDITTSKYFSQLTELAENAGHDCPNSVFDLERLLHESGNFPSRDLIGFYSRNNKFVTQQYLRKEFRPGLATMFIRDFPAQVALHEPIKNYLRKKFEVIAEGPITPELGSMVVDQIRGGNWFVNQMAGEAQPIYWFVCYDPNPQRVTKKISRNYPTCDNMRIVTSKRHLRSLARDELGNTVRIVHASDNSDDAYENIKILGMLNHKGVNKIVSDLRYNDR